MYREVIDKTKSGKRVTIYKNIVERDSFGNIKKVGKKILRIINVHPSYEGIGKDEINPGEFYNLSKDLEPKSDGYDVVDI